MSSIAVLPPWTDPAPGARILLAEDDAEMRRLLIHALRRDGHEVVGVENGLALAAVLQATAEQGNPFDLLVSDVRMPGLSGLAVVRELRHRGSALPVVLITAFCTDDTLVEATELGVVAVFSKPFDVDDLRTAVHYFMNSGGASSRTTG